MKNIIIVVVGLLIIGLAGLAATQLLRSDEAPSQQTMPNTTQESENITKTENENVESQEAAESTGVYQEYSDSAIANAEGDIYLFFHAPWCPQCRSIEQGIQEDGIPSNTTVIKVDYDSNQELRQQYGVTLQTTFVHVNSTGDFINKFVAYDDPRFSSVVENYFNKQ